MKRELRISKEMVFKMVGAVIYQDMS